MPAKAMVRMFKDGIERFYFASHLSYGESKAIVYQYDHISSTSGGLNVDDTGAAVAATANIAWSARTAWWPFGTLREQRRVRRIWAIVKGAVNQVVTLVARRDWVESDVTTTNRTLAVATSVHIEGAVMADSHAVSFSISGTNAPSVLQGIAVDTQPRRARYHTG